MPSRLLKPADAMDAMLFVIAGVHILEAAFRLLTPEDATGPIAFALSCLLLVRLRAAERELDRHRHGDEHACRDHFELP